MNWQPSMSLVHRRTGAHLPENWSDIAVGIALCAMVLACGWIAHHPFG